MFDAPTKGSPEEGWPCSVTHVRTRLHGVCSETPHHVTSPRASNHHGQKSTDKGGSVAVKDRSIEDWVRGIKH
uniref:Uncharacterized protein n=1 Tax=Knipowitschia caucasica TaxID=637954 RepID=A0AAV2KXP1_KNICA